MKSNSVRTRDNLRFRTFIYFIAFAMSLVVIVWIFNILVNGVAYKQFKLASMSTACERIIQLDFVVNGDDAHRIASENNLEVIIFAINAEGGIDYANDDCVVFANIPHSPQGASVPFSMLASRTAIVDSLLANTQSASNKTYRFDEQDSKLLVYSRIFNANGKTYFLYASTPALVQEGLMKDFSRQLLWISCVSVLLALGISFLLSKQISKPIVNISRLARRLAERDFTVKFEGNGYNEIDELSDTLNYVTQELSKTNTMRKDMIANVSHDLKTPLTLIKTSAEILKDFPDAPREKIEERIDAILKETDRMTLLINQMTQLTLSESGNIKANKRIFDLSSLVESVLTSFSVRCEGYTVDKVIEQGISVFADASQIQQVLYNYIDNALKYTGTDKRIRISLRSMNGTARFDCFDSGNGLSEKEKSKIWDRYYRSSNQYTRSQGTGLGLSIVKSILNSHGAVYGVNSVQGKGSDFYFELPICKAD